MGDRRPFYVLKERNDGNRYIGKDEDRKCKYVKKLFKRAALNLLPFCNRCEHADGKQQHIEVNKGKDDRFKRYWSHMIHGIHIEKRQNEEKGVKSEAE